jgi:hypothetical protein
MKQTTVKGRCTKEVGVARSIKGFSEEEWQRFIDRFVDVLEEFDVAGSIVGSYSLYVALENEWLATQMEDPVTNPRDVPMSVDVVDVEEIERAVLGALMLEDRIRDVRCQQPIFKGRNRTVYRAMLFLNDGGDPIDQVTVSEQLALHGKLDEVGGAAYIASLAGEMYSAVNVVYHAKFLAERRHEKG